MSTSKANPGIPASEDPDDGNHDDALRLLAGTDPLASLDLACYEVASVAVHAWRDLDARAGRASGSLPWPTTGGLVRAGSR